MSIEYALLQHEGSGIIFFACLKARRGSIVLKAQLSIMTAGEARAIITADQQERALHAWRARRQLTSLGLSVDLAREAGIEGRDAHRPADRLLQKLRKAGVITWQPKGRQWQFSEGA